MPKKPLQTSWPPLPRLLVEYLEEHVPSKCPDPDDSDRDIWIYVGRRQMVESISAAYKKQERERLKGEPQDP